MLRVSPETVQHASEALPHVLLIVDGFPKTLGGGERIVLRLAELLPSYGYRVSILTFSLAPGGEFDPAHAPCPTYLLPLTKTYNLLALRGALAFRRFLRRNRVALVQTFFESSDLWAGTIARLGSSAKLVWSRRDMGILRGSKHTAAYRALRLLPHAVFAVSDEVRAHVIEVDHVPSERVHTIYNGVNLESYATGSPRSCSQPKHIACVGNVRPVKGHDLLIEAAALVRCRFPEAHFSIAGEVLDSAYFARLQQRIHDLGLSEHFHFAGKISDLAAYLQSADIFTLPSRSEGFSNALIEAMGTGLPCVATRVGGNAEALESDRNGLLIAPEDPQALATALCRLLENSSLAQALGAAAQQTVVQRFTTEAMMRATTESYTSLLSRR